MKRLQQGSSLDLARWLAARLSDACTLVVLRHRGADADQQVREWPFASDTDVNELADEIEACAHEDGRHFRGPTTYGVFAYREAGKPAVARMLLRIEGHAAAGEAFFGETEAADGRGITSQLMRHNEVAARMALGTTAEIIEYYRRALDARDRRIDELEARHFKMLELYEELQSMRHERELDVIREHRADQRTQFFKEKLDMLAPVLMNKLLGNGGGASGSPALGEELMRQFLKSLSPPQIEALMGTLRPEQTAVIGEIYEAYAKRDPPQEAESKVESRH